MTEGNRRWLGRRAACQRAVASAVSTTNENLVLKGSFRAGNFHLAIDGMRSFSDVDLILLDCSLDRHVWEERVAHGLALRGLNLRVSVQQFDSLKGLSAEDSALLSFGELIRFFDRCRTEPPFRSYLFAKTSMRLARALSLSGMPRQIRNVNTDLLRSAEECRLGWRTGFHEDEAAQLLSPHGDHQLVQLYCELLRTGDTASAATHFLTSLHQSSVHPWLKARLSELISVTI